MRDLHIGIDPGLNNTGLAIKDLNSGVVELKTMDCLDLLAFIRALMETDKIVEIVMENAQVISTLYTRYDKKKGDRRDTVAQSVGMNKAVVWIFKEQFIRWNLNLRMVKPTFGLKSLCKNNASLFAQTTGLTISSNEHNRDAYMLIFNNPPKKNFPLESAKETKKRKAKEAKNHRSGKTRTPRISKIEKSSNPFINEQEEVN